MSALRRISTRRLLAICAVTVARRDRRHRRRDGDGGRRAKAVAEAAGERGPGRAHRARPCPGSAPGSSSPTTSSTPPASRGPTRSSPVRRGRLWASPEEGGKLRLELQSEMAGGDTQVLVSDQRLRDLRRGLGNRLRGQAARRRQGRQGHRHRERGAGTRRNRNEDHRSRRARRAERGDPLRRRRAADLHPPRRAEARRRAVGRGRGRLGRSEWGTAARRGLLELVELARSCSWRRPTSPSKPCPPRSSTSHRRRGPRWSTSIRRAQAGGQEPTQRLGVDAVQKNLDFPLTAPATLAGLPRNEVRSIEVDGRTAALATYGKGLGGIAVIESASEPGEEPVGSGDEGGLSLPKVSINGSQGEELDTALGTVLRFSRGGVDYIVAGSVPPAAAEAAARAL